MEKKMESIDIVRACEKDVATLCSLGSETFSETFAGENSEEDMRKYNEEHFSEKAVLEEISAENSVFFIAYAGKVPAAYMKVNFLSAQTEEQGSDSLEIQRIYVLSAFKGRRIGSALLRTAEEFAVELGLKKIWLGVWERNEKAKAFYAHHGFERFGEHVFVLGDDRQTDFLLRKFL